MKSIRAYLEAHPNAQYGLKVSELPFGHNNKIKEIPLYGLEPWIRTW